MAKVALVLSGGGAKGAFQAAAERYAREEKGYSWDIIAGVSVGALNGGMLAMKKYDRLQEMWETMSNARVYTGKLNWWAVVKMLFGAKSALGNGPLKQLIDQEFDPELMKVDLRIGVVSLMTGEYGVFRPNQPEFRDAVLASTAMPIVWAPVKLPAPFGDAVDGGVRNVSPLGDVLDDDPDEVVIINCSPREPKKREKPLGNVLDIGRRSLDIAVNEIFAGDIREFLRINRNVKEAEAAGVTLHKQNGNPYKYFEYKLIEPDQHLGDSLDFSQEATQNRLRAGLEMAKEVLGVAGRRRGREAEAPDGQASLYVWGAGVGRERWRRSLPGPSPHPWPLLLRRTGLPGTGEGESTTDR
ncbi:MAG: patatin-like phospholipase family protein [Chloroflexi bacterium]|nr:patatin-like phospholipase family protein [Chloroflexota bacterium]